MLIVYITDKGAKEKGKVSGKWKKSTSNYTVINKLASIAKPCVLLC